MLPWTANPAPTRCPAQSLHSAPVNAAARPSAVTIPSCLVSRPGSPASTVSSAASGVEPRCSCSSASRPKTATPAACVATAPTPAHAHGTTEPTEKYFDWTAHPTSPLWRSAATIEKVDLRVPFTVGVNLRTVAARLHRAPRARLVLRRVEERPAAVLRAAGLQAPPRPVRHAGRYLGEDAADCTGH